MCSIAASTNTLKLKMLAVQNKVRGVHSHSVYYINKQSLKLNRNSWKSLGELNVDNINIPPNHFAIVHQQAPTTGIKTANTIHPSIINKCHLWHNGIIKNSTCSAIKSNMNYDLSGINKEWDTQLFHLQIYYDDQYNNIDGSFACVHYCEDEFLNIFRNEIAPMYYDEDSFSSLYFNGAINLPPNKIFNINFNDSEFDLEEIHEFKTFNSPYYFGE